MDASLSMIKALFVSVGGTSAAAFDMLGNLLNGGWEMVSDDD